MATSVNWYDKHIKEPEVEPQGFSYNQHIKGDVEETPEYQPTWLDRGKEFGQGLASFAGGTVDLAGQAANLLTHDPLSSGTAGALGGREALFPEDEEAPVPQFDTNFGEEWPQAEALQTPNQDLASHMYRGAGEFTPQMFPAAAIGKGAMGINALFPTAKTVKGTGKHVAKKVKDFMLNLSQTPINTSTAAGFGGAGAVHGLMHAPDSEGKKPNVSFLKELAGTLAGGLAGSGAVGAAKGTGMLAESGYRNLKNKIFDITNDTSLGPFQRSLAKSIRKRGDLDEGFIDKATDAGVDLNAFNIYEDNPLPYTMSSYLKNKKYGDIGSQMEGQIKSKANLIMDQHLGSINKYSDEQTVGKNLSNLLNDSYKHHSDINTANFENVKSKISPEDFILTPNTRSTLEELFISTNKSPGSEGASRGDLNKYTLSILENLGKDKTHLSKLVNMASDVGEVARDAAKSTEKTGTQMNRVKPLINAVKVDINAAAKHNEIKNPEFHDLYESANSYMKKHVIPFRDSEIHNLIKDNAKTGKSQLDAGETIVSALDKTSSFRDLENLVNHFKKHSNVKYKEAVKLLRQLQRHNLEKKLSATAGDSKEMLEVIEFNKNAPMFQGFKDFNGKGSPKTRKVLTEKKSVSSEELLKRAKGFKSDESFKVNELPKKLKETIAPLLKKKLEVERKLSKSNGAKTDATPLSLADFAPKIPAAILGGLITPSFPAAIKAGIIGGGLHGTAKWIKGMLSEGLHGTLTKKEFVEELIRLGAIPAEEKTSIMKLIANYKTAAVPFRTHEDSE